MTFMQLLVQLALASELEHQEYALLVVLACMSKTLVLVRTAQKGEWPTHKVAIQSQNVRVTAQGYSLALVHVADFRLFAYARLLWISISRRSCFSTLAFTSSSLCKHLRAMMYFGSVRVLAMYTRPNFPLPSGRPISKEDSEKCDVRAELHRAETRSILRIRSHVSPILHSRAHTRI